MRRSGALSRVSHRLNAENPTAAIESSVEIAAALRMRLRALGSGLPPSPGSPDGGLAGSCDTLVPPHSRWIAPPRPRVACRIAALLRRRQHSFLPVFASKGRKNEADGCCGLAWPAPTLPVDWAVRNRRAKGGRLSWLPARGSKRNGTFTHTARALAPSLSSPRCRGCAAGWRSRGKRAGAAQHPKPPQPHG